MPESSNWLPELILFTTYQGDWDLYLEALYSSFKADFVDSKPHFPGKLIKLKRYPISKGKECTFWHFIQEGSEEVDRLPDLRRCERIRWPRPIIEALQTNKVYVWKNNRNSHKRIILALMDFSYIVVLEDREKYILPWTAYTVEKNHRRDKLKKEYLAYIKTDTAS
jgi:hypothetical protein